MHTNMHIEELNFYILTELATDEFNLYVLTKCDHQCSVNVHAKMCNMSLLMFC